jgi:hypothetical protein
VHEPDVHSPFNEQSRSVVHPAEIPAETATVSKVATTRDASVHFMFMFMFMFMFTKGNERQHPCNGMLIFYAV